MVAISRHLFDDEGAHRVQLTTDVENAPMRRVAERLGFTFEGVLRSFMPETDGPHDYAMYAIHEERLRGTERPHGPEQADDEVAGGPAGGTAAGDRPPPPTDRARARAVRAARRRRRGRLPAAAPRRGEPRAAASEGRRGARRDAEGLRAGCRGSDLAGHRRSCSRRRAPRREALTDEYISTEHLLLAILATPGSKAARHPPRGGAHA